MRTKASFIQMEKKRLGHAKGHIQMDAGKLMSELGPVDSQFLKFYVFPRVDVSELCGAKL